MKGVCSIKYVTNNVINDSGVGLNDANVNISLQTINHRKRWFPMFVNLWSNYALVTIHEA